MIGIRQAIHLFVCASAVLLLSACSSEEAKLRSEFVSACAGQGAPKEMCRCAYEHLESKYGTEALVEMRKSNAVPQDWAESVVVAGTQCRDGKTASSGGARSPDIVEETRIDAADIPIDDREIEEVIAEKARSESGSEYQDARAVAMGDVTGDAIPDAAVIFTIEVAAYNSSTQYLVLLEGKGDGSSAATDTVAVGGASQRIDGLKVEGGAIKLNVLTPGPDDADCCPTLRSEAEYLWHNGKLKLVT